MSEKSNQDHQRLPFLRPFYEDRLRLRTRELGEKGLLFTPDDVPLLENLSTTGADVNQGWLETANICLVVGSDTLTNSSTPEHRHAVIGARRYFLGTHLGWKDEQSAFHPVYRYTERQRASSVPLLTFIEAQRYLQRIGLDGPGMLRKHPTLAHRTKRAIIQKKELLTDLGYNADYVLEAAPVALSMSDASIIARTNELREQNEDPAEVGTETPYRIFHQRSAQESKRTIKPGSVQAKRPRAIERAIKLFGWSGSVDHILSSDPTIQRYSEARLATHGRLFERHGRLDFSEAEVVRLLRQPLEAHILTLMLGQQYTGKNVEELNQSLTTKDKRAVAVGMLETQREQAVAMLGAKTVRAYERYVEQRKR